jgi:hypothetical protein
MSERLCAHCGKPVVLGPRGYTHTDGPDRHVPTPVRRLDPGAPIRELVSHGAKRPSGDAAHFTEGDGRHTKRLFSPSEPEGER